MAFWTHTCIFVRARGLSASDLCMCVRALIARVCVRAGRGKRARRHTCDHAEPRCLEVSVAHSRFGVGPSLAEAHLKKRPRDRRERPRSARLEERRFINIVGSLSRRSSLSSGLRPVSVSRAHKNIHFHIVEIYIRSNLSR